MCLEPGDACNRRGVRTCRAYRGVSASTVASALETRIGVTKTFNNVRHVQYPALFYSYLVSYTTYHLKTREIDYLLQGTC